MTALYPGLHYFHLGLPDFGSDRSSRGLCAGLKWSGFHYSVASFSLLFSIFCYTALTVIHYQSSKLVQAFSQAPKKNEDFRGKRQAAFRKGALRPSLSVTRRCFLVGQTKGQYPDLFADLLDGICIVTVAGEVLVFVDFGCI